MSTISETSDAQLIDMLRRKGPMSVSQMAAATDVTATAVRQRLSRLMAQGLIERGVADRLSDAGAASRGRPSHQYSLSAKARRQAGSNYGDLAMMLWDEIRKVKDPHVRKGLFERIAAAMAHLYAGQVEGSSTAARMESLKRLFAERQVPIEVEGTQHLPVLTVVDCPYPELAEKDRGICAVEKMLFSQLLAEPVRLSQCRLEGHACCQFQTN